MGKLCNCANGETAEMIEPTFAFNALLHTIEYKRGYLDLAELNTSILNTFKLFAKAIAIIGS